MDEAALAPLEQPPGEVTSFRAQLEKVQALCGELSARHRRDVPTGLVANRIRDLAPAASPFFHERTLEICFLLDQSGAMRFNELRRALGRISTRTLADRLELLQREDLVAREVQEDYPPKVSYHVTAKGRQFTDLLFPALVLVARPDMATGGAK